MNHRERVLCAMRHEQPDRAPLFYRDVPEVDQRLRKDLGLETRDQLLEYFDIDFRWVEPEYIGPPLMDEKTGIKRDIWGVEYCYTTFSDTDGYWNPVAHPLKDVQDADALADYPWPKLEWFDFSTLEAQCDAYEGYAIMTAPGFASPGILQCPIQTLLSDERSLMDLLIDPEFITQLTKHILEFQIPFIDKMMGAAKGKIDFFRLGDDFGTQAGLLMGPDLWAAMIAPALKAMADTAKKHGAYYYQHSCGAIRQLIPGFIEIGVDVVDPLQVEATGMVPAELKAEFGDQVCFSGGIDEQELLPHGTPEEVKASVREMIQVMGKNGGYFVGPTHNFQADIPTENIVAMYAAAKEGSL